MQSEWKLESEDNEGAVFYSNDKDGNKLRLRMKKGDYKMLKNKLFVRLGSYPEWQDPPQQCPID